MKAGWEVRRLGEVVEKVETVDPTKSPDTEFDYVDVSSVSNETFQIEQTTRTLGAMAPSRARRKIRTGDVIFATVRPTLQRIAFVPPELDQQICSTGYMVLRAKALALPKYLYYFLFSASFSEAMEDMQKGASYPAVTDGEVRGQTIPLPPLDEQKRIVEVLDAAFEGLSRARAHTETNLQNARDLFESFLGDFFSGEGQGWSSEQLTNVVSNDCTLSYGIVQPGEEVADGLYVVRPTDLGPRIIAAKGLKRIDPSLAESYRRTTLQGNELLLCVRGTTGTIAIASQELAGANVTRGIVPIRFDHAKITQELGYYLFRSGGVQEQIRAGTYGAALMQINIGDLRKIVVNYPPLNEQKQHLATLAAAEEYCDALQSHYSAKLADLDQLRQALLQKAFAGELT